LGRLTWTEGQGGRSAAGAERDGGSMSDLVVLGGVIVWPVENASGEGARPVPEDARLLHERGRAAGARGDYEQALALFGEAAELAPEWAYPVYDAAFTRLLMGDAGRAEQLYAEVDRMEPRGFYTCRSTLAMVRRERAGELPAGFSKAWLMLEHLDEGRKRAAVETITRRFPAFAPAWRELAKLLTDPGDRERAIETGLAADPDADTRGMLLISRASLLRQRGHHDEAALILNVLLADPSAGLSVQAWAKAMIADPQLIVRG
jgi:tetratricopeptide (TPR) repeat protein